MIIRQAGNKDVMQIAEILVEDRKAAYRGIMDDDFLDSLNVEERYQIEVRRYQKYTVAVENDEVLGYAWNETADDEKADCEIIALYVRYSKRNRGIGRALMLNSMDCFRKAGKKSMIVWCLKDNHEARRFYEKMGGKAYKDGTHRWGSRDCSMISYLYQLEDRKMTRLEKMDDFFAARVEGYDDHMRTNIEDSSRFYAYTASLLPREPGSTVLDLGCGTGLELEEYFKLNPYADITGIDLSEDMLNALKVKFPEKELNLIHGSYFDVPFGENLYDAAVSVESLHHFSAEMKFSLYGKLHTSLKYHGVFVLTDYFAESEELEKEYFENLARLKTEQGLPDDTFYHYDTPLLVEHEMDLLRRAGFSEVRIMKKWGESTYTVRSAR